MQLSAFSIKFSWSLYVTAILSLLFFAVCTHLVEAQTTGVSINPATIEETVDPGVRKIYTLTIENLDSQEQLFYIFTRNISGVRDGGVPIFAKYNDEHTGFELTDWITADATELLVPAKGKASFDFTLNVPDNASPGSHFGGVFVSVDPPEIKSSGAAVGYQVASILSIRVSGEAVEQASIRQFSTSKFLYGSQHVEFNVRIENTGNVLVRPSGPLEINNMLGNQVGTMIFNESRSGVFPNDTREFADVVWQGDSIGFGRYEAILSPVYGDQGAKKTMSSTVVFWILPMNIIGPALAILAVVFLVIFTFVRLYIRRSLAHLNHGRRIVRQRKRGGSSATLLLTVVMLTVIALFLIVLLALFAQVAVQYIYMRQNSQYHRVLRVSAVVCAIVLVFESGLLSESTAVLSQNTHQYLASAIGINASVKPTELNQLTAAITQKERELAAREAALREREIAVGISSGEQAGVDTATYILASILFILLILILLNYTLDYLRARENRDLQPV